MKLKPRSTSLSHVTLCSGLFSLQSLVIGCEESSYSSPLLPLISPPLYTSFSALPLSKSLLRWSLVSRSERSQISHSKNWIQVSTGLLGGLLCCLRRNQKYLTSGQLGKGLNEMLRLLHVTSCLEDDGPRKKWSFQRRIKKHPKVSHLIHSKGKTGPRCFAPHLLWLYEILVCIKVPMCKMSRHKIE